MNEFSIMIRTMNKPGAPQLLIYGDDCNVYALNCVGCTNLPFIALYEYTKIHCNMIIEGYWKETEVLLGGNMVKARHIVDYRIVLDDLEGEGMLTYEKAKAPATSKK